MSKYITLRKSSLTNEILQEESLEEDLQHFTCNRLAEYERLSAYKNEYKKLNELLDISQNDEAVHALVGIQNVVAHSNYLKGFTEGMKFALMVEKL